MKQNFDKKQYNGKPLLFIALLAALCCLTACGAQEREITSLEQLNEAGRKIGVAADTAEYKLVEQELPLAQIEYFQDEMAPYVSVSQGKIDAFVFDKLSMEIAIRNGLEGVRLLDETLGEGNVGAVAISPVSKIPDLEDKINAFLAEANGDGTIQDMTERWLVANSKAMPEIPVPETSDLHLTVGTTGTNAPFTYYIGSALCGYDIELAERFAAWLGATVEFKVYDYDGIIAAAQSGDIDCIFANLFVTPEREEAIRFSDPTSRGEVGVMVRDTAYASIHEGSSKSEPEYHTFEELNGKTVSMLTGAPFEELIRNYAPDVGVFTYFTSTPDMLLALKSGKTDAILINNAIAELAANRDSELAVFPQDLDDSMFGFAFQKDSPERDVWQEAYDAIPEETKNALWEKWTGSDESAKTLPEQDWPGLNGTVQVAACDTLEPMSYAGEGGKIKGFDIEMILTMARELDVHVEFIGMDFSAVLTYVQSGKAQIGTGSIIVTEERSQEVDFVEYYPAAFVLVVRASQTQGATADVLAGKRIGVVTGTIHDALVEQRLPTAQIVYFNTVADMLDALKAGKIDAMVRPQSGAIFIRYEEKDITWLDEHLTDADVSFAFPKTEEGKALNERFSEFIQTTRASGELEELREKWFQEDESGKPMIDVATLPATNGTLRMATTGAQVPFNYVRDNTVVGFEVELAARFCEEHGYGLQVEQMNFDGVLAAVQSGKCDFAGACLAVTEERKESVDFSEPHFSESVVFVVLDSTAAKQDSFLASIADSFQKTFIRENRWQLFIQGIGTTLLITILSIILGTVLGFGVFMLCRNGNPVANTVTRFCVWLVQGMPVVVLLMILYYIIFGKVSISGTAVSVVGFTLVFGAAVYSMVKAGVATVDRGQTEAAYALGYSDRRTFFRVVLPQALPHFMPAYKGEITALIKATAIVGYVAVQDLTKMGDIVRSRTYEAFFPLIAVAVIYFILAEILTFAVDRVALRIDPKRRTRKDILKGVSMDD